MEQGVPFETVTKLEAAERQLRVAIRMFFERKDMIAVHALATAAQEILSRLAKPRRFKGMYEHLDLVLPKDRKEFIKHFRSAQNFFKHAGSDPDEKLEFNYEDTHFVLIDGVALCLALTGDRYSPESTMFLGWFASKYPGVLKPSPLQQMLITAAKKINFENFENVLQFIDKRNRIKVNTRST